jgi:hypothetical protein
MDVGAQAADMLISRLYLNQKGLPDRPRSTLIEPYWQGGGR